MTPGATGETVDGMSGEKIDAIIEAMRHERYRFSPARRVLIPKKNGKMRPLGLPTWSDKLVGEVVRLLLEAYYEPTFSDRSHGFRPKRGCHTALREMEATWTGTVWFIEGDISDCFGSLDHDIMTRIPAEKIHDHRFLRLIANMLKAGYLEEWQYHGTLSGSSARRRGLTNPQQYLPEQAGRIRREGSDPAIHPGTGPGNVTLNTARVKRLLKSARQSGDRAKARELTSNCALCHRVTLWTPVPAAAIYPLRRFMPRTA